MEERPYVHVEKARKIMRKSIYTFLQYYQYFTTAPVILILPFSASVLLSQTLFACSCFNSLFRSTKFSPPPQFVSFFTLYLSQGVFSSLLSLPFALTSLIIAKGLVIQALIHHKSTHPLASSFVPLYKRMLLTQLCNLIFITVVKAAAFFILLFALRTLEAKGFSSNNPLVLLVAKTILYSTLANAGIVCNLALVMAAMENTKGHMAIRKACSLSWSANSTILSLNLPVISSILAIEGLFRYRVVRNYRVLGRVEPYMALEGMFIAYLYSILIVLETIASCLFLKSCKTKLQADHAGTYYYQINLVKKEDINSNAKLEILEIFP